MPNYEIRLRKQKDETSIYRTNRASDFAAVRTARTIAADGDAIEVWKDMDCIYANEGGLAHSLSWPLVGIPAAARTNA